MILRMGVDGNREGLVREGGRSPPTLPTHSPARPHWHSHWAAVYERPLISRLVSLLKLVARVAMVAARAWIALGIRCCSRAM